MDRDRAWRRWRNDVKYRKVRNGQYSHKRWVSFRYISYDFTYAKRNSISEVIEVEVSNFVHFRGYLDHQARLSRDNPKLCSCCSCCNPRKAGNGNSQQVLSVKEGSEVFAAALDIRDCGIRTPNFRWRRRKWKTGVRQLSDDQYGT